MSEGGVNFNKDVGTANVNTGDGQMNTGSGDMAETIDKSQHSTTETHVAGDMHGDIKGGDNIQAGQINEIVEYVDQLETAFNEAVKEDAQPEAEQSEIEPRAIPAAEEQTAPVIVPFEEFDVESIDAEKPEPQMVFSAVRSMAEAETVEPEKAESVFSRFKTMAVNAGPKVGKALLAGSIAFAKGTVKQHPLCIGIQASLESFQE